MSEHTHTLHINDNESHLPNQSFFSWLKSQTALFISQFLGLASVAYVLVALGYYLKHLDTSPEIFNPKNIQGFVIYAHIPFLLLFIVSLLNILDYNDAGSFRSRIVYNRVFNKKLGGAQIRKGRIQLRKFKTYFLYFWILMLVLYFSFIFQINSQSSAELTNKSQIIIDDWYGAFNYLIFKFFVFAFNNLSLMFIFWCFTVLSIPWHNKKFIKREKIFRIDGTIIILLITLCYPLALPLSSINGIYDAEHLDRYAILADAVSGFINAVVFALLIARLDSKFIGLPSFLISILYGYSAVQPLFAVFEQSGLDSQIIKAFVLIAVFLFKIYFFLIIAYALQTGRMLDYLICFPKLSQRVDSIFANQFQFEIHEEEKEVRFSIKKKNSLIYSSRIDFKDIEECRGKIKVYKEMMKRKSSYKVSEVCGTYWINVIDDADVIDNSTTEKICYSIPLKSNEEAANLIEESIEMIPYCKVG